MSAASGVINAILVRWTGGSTWEVDAPSIASYGRSESVLKLPGVTSAGQARTVARAVLDLRAQPRTKTTAGHLPAATTDEPFEAYDVGDLVTAPGPDGTPTALRVQSVTVNISPDGEPEFTPELGSPVDELEDKLARFLAKFGTAPALENGSSPGGSAGADDPGGGYDPQPVDPEPVPPTDPWVDPTINNPTITDPTITDPGIGGTATIGGPENPDGDGNTFATVIVPPPDDGTTEIRLGDPDDNPEGNGKVRVVVDEEGEFETKPGSRTKLGGDTEVTGPVEVSSVVYTKDADPNEPTKGLLWDSFKGLVGRLSGTKGTAANASVIDKDGNWKFGHDDVIQPTVDFTQANVLGLGSGACIDTTGATTSGVYVDCTPGSAAANIVQFGRTGDVSTTTIPSKGAYLLGTGTGSGGAFEVGANNTASGKYCYVAGQAGSGYLDILAIDFIQITSVTSLIIFSQIHDSYGGGSPTGRFGWYFDFDGSNWFIVEDGNPANFWQIS